MTVNLTKGANVSLTQAAPGLKSVRVGLGWDPRSTIGEDFDLDSSAFVLDSSGRVLSTGHFVFFNNPRTPDGCVVHTGDNLTGAGDGDDESLVVEITAVPTEATKIVFAVTIYEADNRKQNFGMVSNAFIRVVNQGDGAELVRYDLGEDFSVENSLVFGELYRHNGEWKFRAVGQGVTTGLAGMARQFGLG